MAFNPADFELVEAPAGSASPYNPADFELVDDGQTGLLEGIGNSFKRGWALSGMAREMEKPQPNPQAVFALQQQMQAAPPSPEYMATMNDELEPVESWNAFKSAPVKVLAELMGESFSAFAGQVADKAPSRMLVGAGFGAGAALAAGQAGPQVLIPEEAITVPAGALLGAGAGFAEASGAASYALEMAGGVLESLERAGVPLDDPQALAAALQDPQRMQVAREFAQRKAVPVAVFDGASAVIGGRMFGGGKVASAMTRLGQGLAETFTQGAMGAAGEASGQLAQSGQITSGRSILAEGVAELPTGLIEIGAGQMTTPPAAQQPAAAPAPAAAAPQPAPFTPPPAAETVVVEEAFGDATTAAATVEEAAPAAEPAINPDDFEVVEMPGETIVTEPPAAPRKIFRGVSPDVDYSSGDQFWSESREVAENYAAQTGTEGTIDEATPDTLPQNLYTATDKPTLKDELELKSEPFAPEFDAEAKTVLQARGFEGIRYESGTDLGGEQATEFHVFGKSPKPTSVPPKAQKLKAKLAKLDPMFADQGFWQGFEQGGYNDQKIQQLEGMVANFSKPKQPAPKTAKGKAAQASPIADIWEQYDGTGEIDSVGALADAVESYAAETGDTTLTDAVAEYRANRMEDRSEFGDRGESGYSDAFVAKVQQAAKQPAAQPAAAAPTPFVLPRELSRSSPRYGMATISFSSDLDRAAYVLANDAIKPSKAAPKFRAAVEAAGLSVAEVVEHGKKVKAAIKQEAGGGAAPRSEVDIRLPAQPFASSQPNTPAQRSKRRIKNMTAQSGAIDLSIVEDLFEYGKTIYRAGMSFGKWASEMVKEFGQGIASFLKQAYDRIVQAYKDSPYSDTTGAVGDVRPKGKPRQFEQKAAQAPGLDADTRAQMGNDPYVPITLRGVAEDAKAWLAENGVEAAERRILQLNSDEITPTPLDFAIGLELTANLSATGQHARAAAVVRTMSRRATSLGQTISTLAMLSRLTPDGIVFYANQTIEQYIGSLPPERQQQIRTAQDGIRQLETDIATTRKRTAEDTIIKGEQGGEKIQDKLKRRIPDKAKKQDTNVSIRSVLTSQATKAEATKQITQILVDSGISQSEATALATAITNRFYKVLEDARKAAAANRRPASGKGRVTFDKLMAKLKDGKVSDQEFIATLAQLAGVPALTPELRAKLDNLTRQYKAATDDDIALVTAARIFEEVHGLVPADFWVKLRAVSYLSMLFAPKTWIRNLGGNQIQWLANAGRDAVINMIVDPAVGLVTGRRTSASTKTGRIKALLTPVQDVKKGYDWNKQQNPSASFGENLRAGIEHLRVLSKMTTQNKFEITDAKEVGRRVFSSRFMQAWEGALSIALGGGDRGFWMSAFRASLAQREAAAKRNGEWTGQPTPEDIEAAYADAMHAIYQNPNVISKNANKVRQALNRLSTFGKTDQFGLGTALMAFTQVPGSITLRGIIEWSPLGMINALYESMRPLLFKASGARAGGQFRQEQFNKAFTQAILGSGGLYIGGYWLYAMGIVTASREEDDDLEAMRRASGMGAYRVNMSALKRMLMSGNFFERQQAEDGDLVVSYDWAQPLAITFAAGAELAKQVETNNREGVKKGLAGKASMAAVSLAAGAKSLEEQPLLSGLSSFMKSWGYSGPLDAVINTVAGIPSMFVPQLVRQLNQLMNNSIRETRAGEGVIRAFSQIGANTPGVSDQFPPRMDIMGQAIERYQYGGNSLFNVLINPALTSRVRTNPVLNEVARLMETTGEQRQFPRQVKRSANINGESIQLSNEQLSAYQYYLGNYTMSMMQWRMASPRYARLPDAEKVRWLAQDLEDVDAATKSALFGHDIRRLTRRQRVMRNNLVNSPLGQSMPPR